MASDVTHLFSLERIKLVGGLGLLTSVTVGLVVVVPLLGGAWCVGWEVYISRGS